MGGRFTSLSYSLYIGSVMFGICHVAEPLVPEPSPFEVEIAIAKLQRYKWPGID
jgi:hypothetical protein